MVSNIPPQADFREAWQGKRVFYTRALSYHKLKIAHKYIMNASTNGRGTSGKKESLST
jgi:hypothetical protein